MPRLTKSLAYAAAIAVPPLAAATPGLSAFLLRDRPARLPPMSVEDIGRVPRPALDPARPTVVVLLGADLTEITDAVGPYEMFARTGRFSVVTAAAERQPTLLSGGLRILPHYSLDELDAHLAGRVPGIVLVPNIPNIAEKQNAGLVSWLRRQAASGATIHSWCKGAMALAHAGLLDGRTATAHWGDLPRLERMYPQVNWVRGVRWVDHGQLIMSAGITSGIDASLRLIARSAGDSVARRVARELRYPSYHFAIEPSAPQYALQASDLVVAANAAYRVRRQRIGIALYPGVNELDLSNVYDAHVYAAVADVETVGEDADVVVSEHGLTLLPSLALGSDGGGEVRELDRFLVSGVSGRGGSASLVAAMTATAPSLRPEYPHAEQPDRFGLEPVLEDLARTADRPTARFALRRLEYRSDDLHLAGNAFPWLDLPLPLASSAAGMLLVYLLGRGSRRAVVARDVRLAVAAPSASAPLPARRTPAARRR